jgi:hypothetical protein
MDQYENKIDAIELQINVLKSMLKKVDKNHKNIYYTELKFLRNKKSRLISSYKLNKKNLNKSII